MERFGSTIAVSDKVMQIENDNERNVFNGDLGVVTGLDLDDGELLVDFDGREVAYPLSDLDTLVPAYAVTIHKSQGSEYPAVVIPSSPSTTPCCSGTSSTPASPGARSL